MIYGKTFAAIGNGDIQILCSYDDGNGYLFFENMNNTTKREDDDFITPAEMERTLITLCFTSKEGVDSLRKALDLIYEHIQS